MTPLLDRSTQPSFIRDFSFGLLPADTITLSNGLNVVFINGGEQDVLKTEIMVNAGKWMDTTSGLSYFTTQALSRGTSGKSSFEIAQTLDHYGAHLETSPGNDLTSLSLYSLGRKTEGVLDILLDILTHPTFPEKELDQLKNVYVQNLRVNLEKTSFRSSRILREQLFGPAHPYGKELSEEEALSIQPKALTQFHEQHFKDLSVIVSGKVGAETKAMVIKKMEGLPLQKNAPRTWNDGPAKPSNLHVDKEGSIQTSIRLGKTSVLRHHPDYPRVLFLNHILGGYFGSRLMKNIREEKGLTYGIYSALHPLKSGSYLAIGADVNKENRDLAIEEIHRELHRLRTSPIENDELETARYHFIGSFQSEMTTAFSHAEKWKNIQLYGLAPNFYTQLLKSIENLQADVLMETAHEYFQEGSFTIVSVG